MIEQPHRWNYWDPADYPPSSRSDISSLTLGDFVGFIPCILIILLILGMILIGR